MLSKKPIRSIIFLIQRREREFQRMIISWVLFVVLRFCDFIMGKELSFNFKLLPNARIVRLSSQREKSSSIKKADEHFRSTFHVAFLLVVRFLLWVVLLEKENVTFLQFGFKILRRNYIVYGESFCDERIHSAWIRYRKGREKNSLWRADPDNLVN